MSQAPPTQITEAATYEDAINAVRALDREICELEKQYIDGKLDRSDYESKQLILKKRRKTSMLRLDALLKGDQDQARRARSRLYANRTVQLLLSGFIGGMVKELVPHFDSDRNARYPILENIDEAAVGANSVDILDELAYAGVLVRRLYERFVRCPKCGSHAAVFLRLKCPECGSLQLEGSKLVEHLVCGGVHEFDDFATDTEVKCPSCQEPLVREGEDYRIVGTFNRCEMCRVHFDEPEKKFVCRTCQDEFELKETAYYDTYTYSLNPEVLAEVKAIIGLPIFKTALEEFGFKVELPGTVSGASGMIHNFTLTGTKNGRTVGIDVVESEGEVDEKDLFAVYTKIMDLNSTVGILIAIPRLAPRAKEFASKAFSKYEISYIEAASPAQALEALKARLRGIA